MELVPSVRVSILADSISSALDGSRGDDCFTKAAGGSVCCWRRGDGALRSAAAWETSAFTKATGGSVCLLAPPVGGALRFAAAWGTSAFTKAAGGSGIILAHLGRALVSPLKMGVKKLWSEGGSAPLFT